jgi:hypothetical protein
MQGMRQGLCIAVLLALSACSALPAGPYRPEPSPCTVSEASYECQVERYQNVSVD